MEISFDEVKRIIIDSIDESKNMNELIQTTVNKIYEKGFNDGRPKYAHDLPIMDSACWNCNHCHDGGALSGWFCDIHGDLNKCNRFIYRCGAWTEKHEYQIDAKNVTLKATDL